MFIASEILLSQVDTDQNTTSYYLFPLKAQDYENGQVIVVG